MKKHRGRKACFALAGLLLAEVISMQVLHAESAAQDQGSAIPAVCQESIDDLLSASAPAANVPAADTTVSGTSALNTSATDTPAAEGPASDTTVSGTPAENTPVTDTPAAEVPASDTTVLGTSAENTSATDTPAADAPVSDVSTDDVPAADTPAADPAVSDAADNNPEGQTENALSNEDAGLPTEDAKDMEAVTEADRFEETPLPLEGEEVSNGQPAGAAKAENVGETVIEEQEEKMEGAPNLDITIEEDGHGAYITYYCEKASELTLKLIDSSNNQVGIPYVINPGGTVSSRKYILEVSGSMFGLSQDVIGKTIKLYAEGKNSSGKEQKSSVGSVTITPPSLTMPGAVNYSVLSAAKDMYDVNVVSGISWRNGSCKTKRIVEKQNGSSWDAVADDSVLTSSDAGIYRIRIQTCLGDYYSNTFRVVVPVASIDVIDDVRIGSRLTAVPKGPDGSGAEVQECSWYFGVETTARSTGMTFTPLLKDVLEAKTLTVRIVAKDYIGNTYTQYVELGPVDLPGASLTMGAYVHPIYNGQSRMPDPLHLLMGGEQIPASLYTAAPASDRNSINAGDAWVTIKGDGTFLSGTASVPFVIDPAPISLGADDFKTKFEYDGKAHMPILRDDTVTAALKYQTWQEKKSDGSWEGISEAPREPGTYRVTVTVNGDNPNYMTAILKDMVFTIEGRKETEKPQTEAPQTEKPKVEKPQEEKPQEEKPQEEKPQEEKPQEEKPQQTPPKPATDLTITDSDGNARSYTAAVISGGGGSNGSGRVYRITADPEKREDGSFALDETGKAIYRQRILRISPALISRARSEGCQAIRFVLGNAGVQIRLEGLNENGTYTLALAQLYDSELTEEEKTAGGSFSRPGMFYAMRLDGSAADLEKAKASGITAYYNITGSASENMKLLFMEEQRNVPGSIPVILDNSSIPVTEDGFSYITAEAGIMGIFTAVN